MRIWHAHALRRSRTPRKRNEKERKKMGRNSRSTLSAFCFHLIHPRHVPLQRRHLAAFATPFIGVANHSTYLVPRDPFKIRMRKSENTKKLGQCRTPRGPWCTCEPPQPQPPPLHLPPPTYAATPYPCRWEASCSMTRAGGAAVHGQHSSQKVPAKCTARQQISGHQTYAPSFFRLCSP